MELQKDVIYGPVQSRRLGRSLGVNVLPTGVKTCNFNCVYCQYGFTPQATSPAWPRIETILDALDKALANAGPVDHVTVAGNGEPTLHPGFGRIVDGLVEVQQRRAPRARLAILSNGSTLNRPDVVHALARFHERHIKLDAGDATTLLRINACPLSIGRLVADLRDLGSIVIQSMFVRDEDGIADNTTPFAVAAWLDAVRRINPMAVHIYSLDRRPAKRSLRAVDRHVLDDIRERVEGLGVPAQVFG